MKTIKKGPKNLPSRLQEPIDSSLVNPIKVRVLSIHNLRETHASEFSITAQFKGENIGQSLNYTINDNPNDMELTFAFELPVKIMNAEYFRSICANHVVLVFTQIIRETSKSSLFGLLSNKKEVRNVKKNGSKQKNNVVQCLLGRCNIDLLPLLLGKDNICQEIAIEDSSIVNEVDALDHDLLYVNVNVTPRKPIPIASNFNILYITIESIYNASDIKDDRTFQAATTVPKSRPPGRLDEFDPPDIVIFKNGTRMVPAPENKGVGDHKNSHPPTSKASFTDNKYIGKPELDAIYGKAPRIEWNTSYRHWMSADQEGPFVSKLGSRKYPVEFIMENPKSDSTFHAMTFLDLNAMTYPGVKKIRRSTMLYKYDAAHMKLNCDLEESLFENCDRKPTKDDRGVKEKTSKTRHRSRELAGTSQTMELHDDIDEADNTVTENEPLVPILNLCNEPMFVVMEIETHKPLVAVRPMDNWEGELGCMISSDRISREQLADAEKAEESFREAVKGTLGIIVNEYADFVKLQMNPPVDDKSPETISKVVDHLKFTGSYHNIKQVLIEQVSNLVTKKFSMENHLESNTDYKSFVTDVETYVSKEPHSIVSTELSMNYIRDFKDPVFRSEEIWHFAAEAEELGHYGRATKLQLERLAVNKSDPNLWFDYAVFSNGRGDLEKALECTAESLSIDSFHQLSILLRGIILYEKEDYKSAERFLVALTKFYPKFLEGLIALHMVYLKLHFSSGIDATLQLAMECMAMPVPHPMQNRDYLIWKYNPMPTDGVFLPAAALFLKLNAVKFAEAVLQQGQVDRSNMGAHLYLMGVCHYKQGRWKDTSVNLKDALEFFGKQDNASVCALLGHCYSRTKRTFDAVSQYEQTLEAVDKSENMHFVHLKLGREYLLQGLHDRAKQVFLNACKYNPTPNSWLGVGIACYKMEQYTNSEKALLNAAGMDKNIPEIWGYLALVNLCLHKFEDYLNAFNEAKQANLLDPYIWEEIKLLSEQIKSPGLDRRSGSAESISTEQ